MHKLRENLILNTVSLKFPHPQVSSSTRTSLSSTKYTSIPVCSLQSRWVT